MCQKSEIIGELRKIYVLLSDIREVVRTILKHQPRDVERARARYELPQPLRVSAEIEETSAAQRESRARHKQNLFSQRATAIFTGLGFAAACIYATVATQQWNAMKCANAIAQANYANDQRAWIGISLPQKGYQIRSNAITKKPIDFLIAVDTVNTGKTPAFKVHGNIVMTVVRKGERLPLGEYGPGHASYAVDGGVMFPGGDMQLAQPAVKHGPTAAEIIVPTTELLRELEAGESFLVVHARIDYLDIRERPHWLTFCRNISSPGLVDPECMAYNNTDKQDPNSQELKDCPHATSNNSK